MQWKPLFSYNSAFAHTGVKHHFYTTCLHQCLSGITLIALLLVYYYKWTKKYICYVSIQEDWWNLNNTATYYQSNSPYY